jgi:4-hydroxybenzoate polyprenyltransferase
MKELKLFIELIRLKKPIGFMLLFWPCAWGLTLAYDFTSSLNLYIYYLILFLTGSILMRSAGCIINDISDKEFDKKVLRTKNRPIASGQISITLGFIYSLLLCLVAFGVLINFNQFTIILAISSMPLAFFYPLMKRFTYWPQLFLGITFNYGLILGWTSINNNISYIPIIIYFGAIFWTLGYDTIYGFQDIADDEIIGVKSTSIKFKNNPKKFLIICYSILITSLLITGYLMELNKFYFVNTLLVIIHLFFYQIKSFNSNNTENCLKIFKSNNFLGLLIFASILLGKLNI